MSFSEFKQAEAERMLLSNLSPRPSVSFRATEDLEADTIDASDYRDLELEYRTPVRIKYAWLCAHLSFGMLLTIYNKYILGKFPCPWLLTAVHSLFSALGGFALLKLGYPKLSTLSQHDHLVLVAYSVLFSVNIVFSNFSLYLVNLAFFQIIRNTSPIFTVILERILFGRSYSTATYIALVPIVLGAALAATGDLHFTFLGLFVSLIGVILGVLKIIVTNRLMTGSLTLPSLELLYRMSIYTAFQSSIGGVFMGELSIFNASASQVSSVDEMPKLPEIVIGAFLLGNGFVALFLNITSFEATKVAGSLAITVWGNIRQTLTLILSIVVLGDF